MMKLRVTLLLLICILAETCLFAEGLPEKQLEQAYRHALRDASVAEKGEIAYNLIAINTENEDLIWNFNREKVLVVTWESKKTYEEHLKSNKQTSAKEDHVVWVTTVPQVQNFCQRYIQNNPNATEENINLRLKQFLGLNFTWQYDVFVEMWVSPKDLFRPCVDPEVYDSKCNLTFGDTLPTVEGIEDYAMFYKSLYFKNFRTSTGVPWTGLGYTFDWGSKLTEQGASEFILVPGAEYIIKRVISTIDYCKPAKLKE